MSVGKRNDIYEYDFLGEGVTLLFVALAGGNQETSVFLHLMK